MKKVFLIILVIIILYLVIIMLPKKDNNSFTIKGYNFIIKSQRIENSNESYYKTSFTYNNNFYYIDFVEVYLAKDKNSSSIIYDVIPPKMITINGKKYECYITDSNEATLYYELPDKQARLEIKIIGKKTNSIVNEEVIRSKELASVLMFSVD